MDWERSAMRGRSMSGFRRGNPASCFVFLEMLTAMSPQPFQVDRDLHAGRDKAQVPRDGVLEREQSDALLVDLQFHGVDGPIAGDDLIAQVDVALHERGDRPGDLFLDQRRHAQQGGPQAFQLLLQVGFHVIIPLGP